MRITDITPQKTVADKKERWVAYGRVSSKSIEQLHSFTAQIRHYTDYFKTLPDCELVDLYMDEGIRCLREAFLNAIAHNDWSSKISPSVYVFSNRIEIVSTGGLPEGLSLQEFYEGCSKPRCPELMRILRDLEYVEQSGFGINKIIEVYCKEVFKITDNFITVSLPFDKDVMNSIITTTETTTETTTKTIKKLLGIIKANPNITAKELCVMLGMTIDGVTYHLNKLKKQGKILRVGSNKSGYWQIKE